LKIMKAWSLGYEKSKKKAKKLYSGIGTVVCPALGDQTIAFTSKGFRHLIRKGRIARPRNEQKRRFVLLPFAEKILKNPHASIEFRQKEIKYKVNRHGEKILMTSNAKFWTFSEQVKDCTVKIVIMQIEDKQKQFISIMGDNVKIDKRRKNKKPRK